MEDYSWLQNLLSLEDDWDSYGAAPPSLREIAYALVLVAEVSHRNLRPPTHIGPTSGSGVEVVWEDLLEVCYQADGTVDVFCPKQEDMRDHKDHMEKAIEDLQKRVTLLEEMVGTSKLPKEHRDNLRLTFGQDIRNVLAETEYVLGETSNVRVHVLQDAPSTVYGDPVRGHVRVFAGSETNPEWAFKVEYQGLVVVADDKYLPRTLEQIRMFSNCVSAIEDMIERYPRESLEALV